MTREIVTLEDALKRPSCTDIMLHSEREGLALLLASSPKTHSLWLTIHTQKNNPAANAALYDFAGVFNAQIGYLRTDQATKPVKISGGINSEPIPNREWRHYSLWHSENKLNHTIQTEEFTFFIENRAAFDAGFKLTDNSVYNREITIPTRPDGTWIETQGNQKEHLVTDLEISFKATLRSAFTDLAHIARASGSTHIYTRAFFIDYVQDDSNPERGQLFTTYGLLKK